ncbi:hypothetical protein [Nonlabens antarcticus]|uniref:hypothetical protein n=1 Tax=Nonlabens antarcticus TaxID=392714 RepID=UPI0018910CA3|nr:hypothetical protein [Nonlabens antarcticus]
MKNFFIIIAFAAIFTSCKNDKPEETVEEKSPEFSMQVAQNAGLDQWNDVKQIDFTFNAERNGETMTSRSWQWNPKSDQVTLNSNNETITYNRGQQLDSLSMSADRAFVNDVYWLLPQFKLAWDTGKEVTYPETTEGKMIQVQYTGENGYTPGDRYDMYVDDNKNVTKWSYYPKGTTTPAMTTSFEDYQDYNGIKIATNHRTEDGALNIYFTNINVTK